MANGPVDPASLEGEALMRWYRRTPQEIENERRQTAADAYNRYFYSTKSDPALNPDATAADTQAWLASDGQGTIGQDNGEVRPWSTSPAASMMEGPNPFASSYGTGILGEWRRYAPAPSGDSWADRGGFSTPTSIIDAPTQRTAESRRDKGSASSSDDTLWIATGSGGYRAIRSGNSMSGARA